MFPFRGTEQVERPADQYTIVKRYTDASIQVINSHQKETILSFCTWHTTCLMYFLLQSNLWARKRGLYGDVVEERILI